MRENTDSSTQIWYSSRKNSQLHINSLIGFKNYTTEVYLFEDTKDVYSFTGTSNSDYANFACYYYDCFFKSILDSKIGTFKSCNYNQYMDLGSEDYQTLTDRSCNRCQFSTPYSLGFAKQSCETCADIAPSIENSVKIDQYMFDAACTARSGNNGEIIDDDDDDPLDPVVDNNTGTDTNEDEVV